MEGPVQGNAQVPVAVFPGVLAVVRTLTAPLHGRGQHLDFLGEMFGMLQHPPRVRPGEIHRHRLLTEDEPVLSNFEGDRVARERMYLRRDLAEGLLAFTTARTRNLQRLREVSAEDWKRAGRQEGVGRIELSDVPRMMTEHDRAHGVEIAELVAELRDRIVPPPSRPPRVSAFA